MGISQSNIVTAGELVATGAVIAASAYFLAPGANNSESGAPGQGKQSAKNKRKRDNAKKGKGGAEGQVENVASSIDTLVGSKSSGKPSSKPTPKAPLPIVPVLPSEPEPTASSSTASLSASKSSSKKRKPKSTSTTPTPAVSTILTPDQPQLSSAGGTTASSVVDDDGWTKVGRGSDGEFGANSTASLSAGKKAKGKKASAPPAQKQSSESTTTEEEGEGEEKLTLAEKLLPKPAVTVVDDMLDKPAGLARVMRVVGPDTQPPAGFSWGDFEDVEASKTGTDDDDGWNSVPVKSRKKPMTGSSSLPASGSATPKMSSSTELTKKQRQNQAKREAEKAQKAAEEKARVAKLAKHKKDLENERIKALYANKGGSGSNSKLSGGMKATVDEKGNMYWE